MRQLSALALLVSSVAVANQSVTATGSGDTLAEAKRDALYQASMRYCPTTVVNDREYRNEQLTRNNLTAYNGCLVKNYQVVDEQGNNGYYSVTVNAEVVPNHLSARIINQHPDWFYYDTDQHNDRVAQLVLKQQNATNLVDEIFNDFPSNAFTVNTGPLYITYQGTKGYLNVPYKVTWNPNYLLALGEMLQLLSDSSQNLWRATFADAFRDTTRFHHDLSSMTLYRKYIFNDGTIFQQVRNYLKNDQPLIRVRVTDDNGFDSNVCYRLNSAKFYSLGIFTQNNFTPNGKIQDTLHVGLSANIPDNAKYTVDIVSSSFCDAIN